MRSPWVRAAVWVLTVAVLLFALYGWWVYRITERLSLPPAEAARPVEELLEPTQKPVDKPTLSLSGVAGGMVVATQQPPPLLDEPITFRPFRFLARVAEPILAWLAAYPLFPLAILFYCLASWGGLLRGLGVPDLLWPDEPAQRFWAGLAVSLVFVNLLFVRYLLELPDGGVDFGVTPSLFWYQPWVVFDPVDGNYPWDPVRMLGSFLLWTWLPCLALYYVPKMGSRRYWKLRFGNWYEWPLSTFTGLAAGVVFTVLIFWFDTVTGIGVWLQETPVFSTLPGFADLEMDYGKDWADSPLVELHARAMVMAVIPVIILAIFAIVTRLGAIWSPVWVFSLWLGLFTSVYGFVAYHLSGLQYLLLLCCIPIWWVCNKNHSYKMSFPGLADYYKKRVDLDAVATSAPVTPPPIRTDQLLAAFEGNWKAGPGEGTQTKPKLVIVGASGGGIRAAVWTAVVLEELEAEFAPRVAFRDHIRLFTGASGGMVGAALYTATFEGVGITPNRLSDQLGEDSLWGTVQTMLFRDLPAIWFPWSVGWDRGRSLEAAWHANTKQWPTAEERPGPTQRVLARLGLHSIEKFPSPLERTFAQLRPLEAAARRPSLIFSPMLVEDCRRLLISNLDLEDLTQAMAESLNPADQNLPHPSTQSRSAVEFRRAFPQAFDKFQVGTAARMSATFPFVGPGVSLPSDPPRRVVDAGYFDNFGVNLAALWLLRHREAILQHTSGVVLIETRAFPRRAEKVRFSTEGGKGDLLLWGASEVSTPLEAVINLYARGAYFRNDQLLHVVNRAYNVPGASRPFFTTIALECASTAALSWTMPAWEVDAVRHCFRGENGVLAPRVAAHVNALKGWFGTGGDLPMNVPPHPRYY